MCDRLNCSRDPVFHVGFAFHSKDTPVRDRTPVNAGQVLLGVKVCRRCGKRLGVSDVVSDEGWRQLQDTLAREGRSGADLLWKYYFSRFHSDLAGFASPPGVDIQGRTEAMTHPEQPDLAKVMTPLVHPFDPVNQAIWVRMTSLIAFNRTISDSLLRDIPPTLIDRDEYDPWADLIDP